MLFDFRREEYAENREGEVRQWYREEKHGVFEQPRWETTTWPPGPVIAAATVSLLPSLSFTFEWCLQQSSLTLIFLCSTHVSYDITSPVLCFIS